MTSWLSLYMYTTICYAALVAIMVYYHYRAKASREALDASISHLFDGLDKQPDRFEHAHKEILRKRRIKAERSGDL